MNIKTSNVEYTSYPNNEWIVNFGDGGDTAPKSNLETIAQAVRFALETGRFKYPIMGSNFGTIFDDLIGADYDYIQSEIARRMTDALLVDDRIVDVANFRYTRDGSNMAVTCTVQTILGNIEYTMTLGEGND